ncbi:MAG: hypothetical protein M3Z00_02840, partial [Actinomycetota bacterium]|nr:hypothetical protein [Actinomycetota bacterium]
MRRWTRFTVVALSLILTACTATPPATTRSSNAAAPDAAASNAAAPDAAASNAAAPNAAASNAASTRATASSATPSAALPLAASPAASTAASPVRGTSRPTESVPPPLGTADPPALPLPPGRIDALPGMPPVLDPSNVYSASAADKLAPQVRRDPAYAYVPHNGSSDVWVIDQHTHAVIRRCFLGGELQHVVPSYDLRQLYATSDTGNKIMVINPATGRCGRIIPVIDPYNLYFTPD